MGDPSESAETCGLPWYRAFSALCAGVGSLAGAIAAAALSGAALTFVGAAWAGSGAIIGALIAYCACRMSPGRLPRILPPGNPTTTGETTIAGVVIDVGRTLALFPFGDGDYLFNIKCVDRRFLTPQSDGTAACIRTKSLADGPDYLHCEITSNVTLYGCAGAIAGAAAATIVAIPAAIAAGGAVAAACGVTGPFAPLCVIAAILVALLVSAAITGGGAMAGGAIGSGLGVAADEVEDQVGDAEADALHEGDAVIFTGDWVTDADHGWNEMHDINRAMVIDGGFDDCGRFSKLASALAAGLHRHPRDPH